MNSVNVVGYKDEKGCPVEDWLDSLPRKINLRAETKIELLKELGHEIRRPHADYLRDGIYELRWKIGRVNYRILYFFHGREAVVLSHGLTKEDIIPTKEIEIAIQRKIIFEKDPMNHRKKILSMI